MRLLVIGLLCLTSLVACKRQKPVPPPPPPPVDVNAKEPTLAEMNEAVQAWVTSRGRAPESLEELAKARFISKVPTPPAGRQYVIDKDKFRVVLQ
ncbi:MAG: hypothetical protein EBS05_08990 [Proteobacteria bacterium]|jgi:hypothetical protein|nr:hypothetical protein [Pseudomonadota bacterium]